VWLGFLTSAEVASNPRWRGWLIELAAQKRAAHFDVGGSTLWIAAERLPHFRALWPRLKTAPALAVPPPYDKPAWSREDVLSRSCAAGWKDSALWCQMNLQDA
jgi:ATP-dependent Lhr-like helicase